MPTIQVNMHEAKSRLSQLGEQVWAGERVVIARSGKPYLDLFPHQVKRKPRKPGRFKGQIKISKSFEPTPADIIDAFEGTD